MLIGQMMPGAREIERRRLCEEGNRRRCSEQTDNQQYNDGQTCGVAHYGPLLMVSAGNRDSSGYTPDGDA